MAKRSTIATLPPKVLAAFERRLAENGFSNYTELTEWLNGQGYEVSRSAVHHYGQKVERRFASIKASTEAARLIAEGAADEGDTRSEALMAMLQTELFDALVQIGEMDNDELGALDRFGVMAEGAKKKQAALLVGFTHLHGCPAQCFGAAGAHFLGGQWFARVGVQQAGFAPAGVFALLQVGQGRPCSWPPVSVMAAIMAAAKTVRMAYFMISPLSHFVPENGQSAFAQTAGAACVWPCR